MRKRSGGWDPQAAAAERTMPQRGARLQRRVGHNGTRHGRLLLFVGGQTGLARLFLKVREFLLGGFNGLFLAVDFRLLLAAVFGELALVAELDAGIAVKGCGIETLLALGAVKLMLKLGN